MDPLPVPIDTGEGPPLVLLHGYAMRPDTYHGLVELLAPRCRVIVPDLFDVGSDWSYPGVLGSFVATLDHLGLERVSMVAHSFGGGLQLGFASEFPERVVELVFSDTLGVRREWRLADEALRHPLGLLRLATPSAMASFAASWVQHPRQLVQAAWWAFTSSRDGASQEVASAGLRSHVLWANRDSVLNRRDGEAFARALEASFTVAAPVPRRPVDHDWM
ncbi:MAG TPA: alpha/beta fold hydrolase, partial [Acidimicrobiales bacterium]|nr:alpha/beta fold hydrolase [Acidimicrobiales bacterium]